jgi:uncharacterized protein (UPF0548 family)
VISLRRPSPLRLDDLLAEEKDGVPTYPEIGATRGELPYGYRHDHHRVALGTGHEVFERAAEGLRRWQAHRGAGAEIWPVDVAVEQGTDVLVVLRIGPAYAVAPCRIVYVDDDATMFGFGYGTLFGHPERGEEAFHVTRSDDDEVFFTVTAFSRPADPLVRLASPVSRLIQRRVTQRYLDAMQAAVTITG